MPRLRAGGHQRHHWWRCLRAGGPGFQQRYSGPGLLPHRLALPANHARRAVRPRPVARPPSAHPPTPARPALRRKPSPGPASYLSRWRQPWRQRPSRTPRPFLETAHCGGARKCGHSPPQIHWAALRQRPLQLHPASPSAPPAHRLPHANRSRPTRTWPHRQPPNPLPSPPPQIPAASRAPTGSARRPVRQDPSRCGPTYCLN